MKTIRRIVRWAEVDSKSTIAILSLAVALAAIYLAVVAVKTLA